MPPGLIFPYLTRATTELLLAPALLVRDGRLAYPDEREHDRDRQQILWARQMTGEPHHGTPVYGHVNVARQRHATLALLCQVCGGDPDEDDEGILWLVPAPANDPGPDASTWLMPYPPVCQACCHQVIELCPALRREHYVLKVADVQAAGVLGTLYTPGCRPISGQELIADEEIYLYGDPRLPMVLALQQVLRLAGCQIIERDQHGLRTNASRASGLLAGGVVAAALENAVDRCLADGEHQ